MKKIMSMVIKVVVMSAIKKIEYLEGQYLEKNGSLSVSNPNIIINGKTGTLMFNNDLLSRHLLSVGSTGTGKTNGLIQLIKPLKEQMTDNDIMIIFDSKGDYYESLFDKNKDIVISNDSYYSNAINGNYWNVFKELKIDGDDRLEENILEICNSLFQEKIQNSTANQFFPKAARDLMFGILWVICFMEENPSNKNLYELLKDENLVEKLHHLFKGHEHLKCLVTYIDNPRSGQTQGIMSELLQVSRELLVGNFRQCGELSIRDLIRQKKGKTIFIEYDLSIGKVLTPIYRLLIDLAIKETLSRRKSGGNTYFVIDEFMLLPNLYHIENGVNFGRSFGAKFIIAIQNIDQIHASYGDKIGNSILSSFNTKLFFRVTDGATREYIKSFFGTCRIRIAYSPIVSTQGIREEVLISDVIEDWRISKLGVGEAIVSSENKNPFIFSFNQVV